jgi:hypothetical protein
MVIQLPCGTPKGVLAGDMQIPIKVVATCRVWQLNLLGTSTRWKLVFYMLYCLSLGGQEEALVHWLFLATPNDNKRHYIQWNITEGAEEMMRWSTGCF